MTRQTILTIFLAIFIALLLGGCGGGSNDGDSDGDGGKTTQNTSDGASDNGDDDADHEQDGDDHAHEGEQNDLGAIVIDGYRVAVTQTGHVHANEECNFDVEVSGDVTPVAVRLWIGVESAMGSVKAKVHTDGGSAHAHVEAPAEIDGARLWVEIELEDGSRKKGSLELH